MVLHALAKEVQEALFGRGEKRSYRARAVLMRRGDAATSMFVVHSGRAEISLTTSLGHRSILGIASPGDFLGDIACLDGGPRSADVIALDPMEVLIIQRRDVMAALRDDPDSAQVVIEELCKKARNASDMFELQSLVDSGARMASCVIRLIGADDEPGYDGTARVSQSWLGEYAGLSRENVNRQLQVWSRDGMIELSKGMLKVLDRERLEDIALDGSSGRRGTM